MKPRFISVRADGLGSRLRTILNAVALAQECGGTFEFAWPDNPNTASGEVLGPAKDIFSQSFLDRHHREGWLELFDFSRGEGPKRDQFRSHLLNRQQIREIIRTKATNQACQIAPIYIDIREELKPTSAASLYRDAFQSLEFADDINGAIQAAHDEFLPENTTAIHLRAGDIMEGGYRFSGYYTKWVLPFPLAQHLIKMEQDMGRDVVIFGQDPAVIQHLCAATGAISAADLVAKYGFGSTQEWFYETCLMARCRRIISGGESSFSQLASWVGISKNINGYQLFDGKSALSLTLMGTTESAPIPNLQKAFSFWSVVEIYGSDITPSDCVECLRKAVTYDPVNSLYKISLVSSLVNAGAMDNASARLASLITEETKEWNWSPGCLRETLHVLRLNSFTKLYSQLLASFEILHDRNEPAAALFIALTSNDPKTIDDMTQTVINSDWEAKAFFAHALKRRLEDAQATRAAQA